MKPEGVLFMLISWAVILGLFAYSMVRTLSHKHRNQLDKETMPQDEDSEKP